MSILLTGDQLQDEYLQSGLLENKIDDDFFTNLIVNKLDGGSSVNEDIDTEHSADVLTDSSERVKSNSNIKKITEVESRSFVNILKQEKVIKSDGKLTISGLKKIRTDESKRVLVKKVEKEGIDKQSAEAMIDQVTVRFDIPKPIDRSKRTNVNLTNRDNPYLKDLWNKICHKVNYRVKFSEDDLIEDIVNGNNPLSEIRIKKMTAVQTRARINLLDHRVENHIVEQNTERLTWSKLPIIDVAKQIADGSGLTRQAVVRMILQTQKKNTGFIDKIKMNPTLFAQRALNNIKAHQRNLLNKSLVYVQNGETWSQDKLQPFNAANNTLWKVPERGFKKTLFEQIATQSEEENNFAESLINENKIKYFLKLPNWFKIPTPFGNYNPDWAILAETNDVECLYFVVDTKTTLEMSDLREEEQARINAGRQSYKAKGFEDVSFEAPIKVIGDIEM
ncbi:restriction endonuclease [Lactiplantibacillus plajomi]|uniref:Type III restriction enzyme C-terminal endonuclease domain-containing protein n=1 Tax=Lactiplantibacillus plajomi TaxID=1457217 RepID=A0ABV6K1A1_9LACO|nr:hypothetical protein [Lactiplantibacillus plajomi]